MRTLTAFVTLSFVLRVAAVHAEEAPVPPPAAAEPAAPATPVASGATPTSPSNAPAPVEASPPPSAPPPVAVTSPPAVTTPAPVTTTSPKPLPPDHSFVHLGSDYVGAQLELKSSIDQSDWRAVCIAPCDIPVPVAGALARVTAPGMTSSNSFRIEPGAGTALVRVDGGSARARALGITGLMVGIPTAAAGMALFGYGKLQDQDGARIAGAVVLATGAVVLVASLPLLLMGSTKVRDAHGSVIAETLRTGQATF